VGAVIGGVHDNRVVGEAKLVELVQHSANVFVVGDHHVVVVPLTALAPVLLGGVGPEMHRRGVVPEEDRLIRLAHLVDGSQRMFRYFVVDGFHPLTA